MRYIVCRGLKNDTDSVVRMTTYAAFEAETEAQAREQFAAEYPGCPLVYIHPARPEDKFHCGEGYYTKAEQEEHRRKLNERYEEMRRRQSPALEDLLMCSLDEFAARQEYEARRAAESTPNAEGIHIGDIFSHMFGYNMTCYEYYQVVGLKGKHTIIVKENARKMRDYDSGQGYCRPIRDQFYKDTEYTVRTGTETHNGETVLKIKPPASGDSWGRMKPFFDGQYNEYDHND